MSRWWRRQLAETLGLPLASPWEELHKAIADLQRERTRAVRDYNEMVIFVRATQLYWWQRGAHGGEPPDPDST